MYICAPCTRKWNYVIERANSETDIYHEVCITKGYIHRLILFLHRCYKVPSSPCPSVVSSYSALTKSWQKINSFLAASIFGLSMEYLFCTIYSSQLNQTQLPTTFSVYLLDPFLAKKYYWAMYAVWLHYSSTTNLYMN